MADQTLIVIGGGVIGACSAYYLAERGQRVTLLEQGEIAAGSSYGNAGFIVPSHGVPLASPGALASGLRWLLDPESPFYIKPRPDPDLIAWLLRFSATSTERHVRRSLPVLCELGRASIALYDSLAALDGMRFGYRRDGLLCIYKTRQGLEHGAAEAALVGSAGVASKVLTAGEARALEPSLRPDAAGAVHYPGDAHLDPAEFVRALARRAEAMGAAIRTHAEVLGIEAGGRRIRTVRTTRGDFDADEVVLAAGSWSPGLARDLGLRLPIQPAKGYSLTFKRPAVSPRLPLLLGESRVAVTPLDDRLRLGGTLELSGLDLTINRRRVDAIRRAAQDYVSGLERLEMLEIWRGLRPCTPDGLPIVGRVRAYENLIVAAGHATVGMSLGPITGKLVAQMICGEPPDMDPSPLSPRRFSNC